MKLKILHAQKLELLLCEDQLSMDVSYVKCACTVHVSTLFALQPLPPSCISTVSHVDLHAFSYISTLVIL